METTSLQDKGNCAMLGGEGREGKDGVENDLPPLPRIVYIGDVAVAEHVAGSLVLYRLLASYPAESVFIVEVGVPSEPHRRLRGVRYLEAPIPLERMTRTRLTRVFGPIHYALASVWDRKVVRAAAREGAEAVLTVPHGPGWLTAFKVARRLGLPWHLIIHDHHWTGRNLPPQQRRWIERRFGEAYRGAASRLCVSPRMERYYRSLFGIGGRLLYPGAPAGRTTIGPRPPREGVKAWAFVGSVFYDSLVRLLRMVADLLDENRGEKLEIYGPATDAIKRGGLFDHPRITYCGLFEPEICFARVAATADGLVLPFSFDPGEEMHLSFPSKLVDYTALGLPILAVTPADSTVAEWVRENPESALLVTDPSRKALEAAMRQLRANPELRLQLARGALAAGERCFTHDRVRSVFLRALCGTN